MMEGSDRDTHSSCGSIAESRSSLERKSLSSSRSNSMKLSRSSSMRHTSLTNTQNSQMKSEDSQTEVDRKKVESKSLDGNARDGKSQGAENIPNLEQPSQSVGELDGDSSGVTLEGAESRVKRITEKLSTFLDNVEQRLKESKHEVSQTWHSTLHRLPVPLHAFLRIDR